jgi:hypothetical protein
VFSLRHSKEERDDLDWKQEVKGRIARREAEEKSRDKSEDSPGRREHTSTSVSTPTTVVQIKAMMRCG